MIVLNTSDNRCVPRYVFVILQEKNVTFYIRNCKFVSIKSESEHNETNGFSHCVIALLWSDSIQLKNSRWMNVKKNFMTCVCNKDFIITSLRCFIKREIKFPRICQSVSIKSFYVGTFAFILRFFCFSIFIFFLLSCSFFLFIEQISFDIVFENKAKAKINTKISLNP